MSVDIKSLFKEVDKINKDGSWLSSSTFAYPDDWISTGCYALNAILSGSLYKGVPKGRITGFQGESQTGKTMMIYRILAEGQRKGYTPVIWDTEGGIDRDGAERMGLDPDKVKYYPIDTVEDCRNQISRLLDVIIERGSKDKIIIVIDSLGNLSSQKELIDAEKDKTAQDMGLRAKTLKSMMRVLTFKAAKSGVPILFTNHIYDDPGAMFPSLVKNPSGGKGATYLASLLVQLTGTRENIDDKSSATKKKKKEMDTSSLFEDVDEEVEDSNPNTIAIAHKVNGVTLNALTVKNRFVPPFLRAELYLNFRTGLDPHAGLVDMAKSFGILQAGRTWKMFGESIGYRKNFEKDPAFWEKLLPVLEERLQKELKFSDDGDSILQKISEENKKLVSEEELDEINEPEEQLLEG